MNEWQSSAGTHLDQPLPEPVEVALAASPETAVEVADVAKPDLPMRASAPGR